MTIRNLIADNPDLTDAEILALAQANPCTVRPIRLDELRPLLAGKGILGKLAMAAQVSPDAANAYAYIQSPNTSIRSDLPEFAEQLEATMDGLTVLGLSEADRGDIISLGGGYATRGETVEGIAETRAAMVRDEWATGFDAELQALVEAMRAKRDAYLNGVGELPVVPGVV